MDLESPVPMASTAVSPLGGAQQGGSSSDASWTNPRVISKSPGALPSGVW